MKKILNHLLIIILIFTWWLFIFSDNTFFATYSEVIMNKNNDSVIQYKYPLKNKKILCKTSEIKEINYKNDFYSFFVQKNASTNRIYYIQLTKFDNKRVNIYPKIGSEVYSIVKNMSDFTKNNENDIYVVKLKNFSNSVLLLIISLIIISIICKNFYHKCS